MDQNQQIFFQAISNYEEGDWVIHRDNGIGKFLGLKTISIQKINREFILLEYLNEDKLYVPVENIDLISKYSTRNSKNVELDKLGSKSWGVRKKKVKSKIKEAATQLIKIAALRMSKKALQLEKCPNNYKRFCEEFPFVETEDQLKAMNDVANDLRMTRPMDRLVCGDVGFGKTEVALRAACIATLGTNKVQVAVIVPSTLLVMQHEKLFKERFFEFPVNICAISRLGSKQEIVSFKEELKLGKVDVVIGTHALLAKDVQFNNLGLLIIDEEHHFGVFQKEQLKNLNSNVHILSLSATPIPRTLHLSLSGVKDLSIIATPPTKRKPITTSILPFSEDMLKEALTNELERGGKALIVTPRIKYIAELERAVKKNLPEIKSISLHGSLSPESIKKHLNAFKQGDCKVLICTQIVESGLDIEGVNTIIIDRANMFGLAQLYQIRGRVGRREEQAYAYITYQPKVKLTTLAQARLDVMRSLESLGGGFDVAAADMDIRGYGNLLGEEQAGHIKDIGIELYQKMLAQEILDAKKSQYVQSHDEDLEFVPNINLKISALIPETYIGNNQVRLSFYKKIVEAQDQKDVDDVYKELTNNFGPIPEEVENLVYIVQLRELAKVAHIEKIDATESGYYLKFYQDKPKNTDKIVEIIKDEKNNITFSGEQKLFLNAMSLTKEERCFKLTKTLRLFG